MIFELIGHCSNEFQSRVLSPKIVPDTQFVFQLLLSSEISLLENLASPKQQNPFVTNNGNFIGILMKIEGFSTSKGYISGLRRSWKTNWVSGTIFGTSSLD